jgi:hypothetical protein
LWLRVSATPAVLNDRLNVTLDASGGGQFFRLRQGQ